MRTLLNPRRRSDRRFAPPGCETLETRTLLAAKVAPMISIQETGPGSDGQYGMTILGTTRNDSITISDNGGSLAGNIRVTTGDGQDYTSLHPINSIGVLTGRGKDSVFYNLKQDLIVGPDRTVVLGSGTSPTLNSNRPSGGTLQATVDLAGGVKSGARFTLLAYSDVQSPTLLQVRQSGKVDGQLAVGILPRSSSMLGSFRSGPMQYYLRSTGTIGAGGTLTSIAYAGTAKNTIDMQYVGTNDGNLNVVAQAAGASDNVSASISMNAGSKGTIGTSTQPSSIRADGARARAVFVVSRGTDSSASPLINALIVTKSRKSIATRTANVVGQTSGTVNVVA